LYTSETEAFNREPLSATLPVTLLQFVTSPETPLEALPIVIAPASAIVPLSQYWLIAK
jgi:hypothetical protein